VKQKFSVYSVIVPHSPLVSCSDLDPEPENNNNKTLFNMILCYSSRNSIYTVCPHWWCYSSPHTDRKQASSVVGCLMNTGRHGWLFAANVKSLRCELKLVSMKPHSGMLSSSDRLSWYATKEVCSAKNNPQIWTMATALCWTPCFMGQPTNNVGGSYC